MSLLGGARPAPPAIERLLASGLAPEEIPAWLNRHAELALECGCTASARAFVAALLIYPPAWWLWMRSILSGWSAVAAGALFAFGSLVAGKLAGLMIARIRLRRLLAPIDAQNTAGRPAKPGMAGGDHG